MQQLSREHFQAGEKYLPTAVYFSSKSLLSFWNSCSGKLKEIRLYVTESHCSPNIHFYHQTITLKTFTIKKAARALPRSIPSTHQQVPNLCSSNKILSSFSLRGHDQSYSPCRKRLTLQRDFLLTYWFKYHPRYSRHLPSHTEFSLEAYYTYEEGLQQSLLQRQPSGQEDGFVSKELELLPENENYTSRCNTGHETPHFSLRASHREGLSVHRMPSVAKALTEVTGKTVVQVPVELCSVGFL